VEDGVRTLDNRVIATRLEEVADLLEAQGANVFRVAAYRRAAETLRNLRRPVADIIRHESASGLVQLPGIGRSLADAVDHLVRTGRLPLLERLRGDMAPERVFATVANIGPELARRIHDSLGIETLAELEAAANDGRLADVPGMGAKRIRSVRESLAGRMHRTDVPDRAPIEDEPPVAELLDVDRQYRRLAQLDRLPRIAPRRFNPTGQAWLPILHAQRDDRHYTVLFSNTARAHELGTTHDWVVIYRDDERGHGQWTVITSSYGRLRGRRIVRGREQDCSEYYASQDEKSVCLTPALFT
jgi:DNA polymerase/3'-5' exonuclease PolX